MAYDLVDFQTDVLQACQTQPVVIDFWAEWCGPCKALTPTLEKLAKEAAGNWKFVKINTEEHQQIAAQFQIRSIPNVKMVYKGKLIAELQGALPESEVRKWLDKHLPEEFKSVPEEDPVESYLESGQLEMAKSFLEQKARTGQADDAEIMRYALLLLPKGVDEAVEISNQIKDAIKFDIEKQAIETVAHLSTFMKTPYAGEGGEKMIALYNEAINLFFANDIETALQKFLEVLSIDRKIDDDGARKACLAIFAMLSEKHPLTKAYRRRFSMALY